MSRLTIIIPTLNEALHIERAIGSCAHLGDVFVVDAGSTDATASLASEAGAHVAHRPWLGYAGQKNWALENIPFETDWVMFLDADEWLPVQLVAELGAVIDASEYDAYYVARRNFFLGRELKHVWWYPDYQLRLWRAGRGTFEERAVHEHVVVSGTTGYLKEALCHENLKGIDAFLTRHVKYAALEASELVAVDEREQVRPRWLGSRLERRRALKRLWYRLPFRPSLRFAWLYVVRRGFLDGAEGRIYAQLIASYEAMIDAKVLEMQHESRSGGSAAKTNGHERRA